jgi:hypothetical protein
MAIGYDFAISTELDSVSASNARARQNGMTGTAGTFSLNDF